MFRNLVIAFVCGYVALFSVAIIGDRVATRSVALLKASHDHELDVANASRVAVRLIIDLENAERSYLLTGEPKLLEPYEAARRQIPIELGKLRDTVGSDAESLALVQRLGPLTDAWLQKTGDPIIADRRAAPPGPPSSELVIAQGKPSALSDQARAVSQAVRERTHALTVEADRAGTDARDRLRHIVELGGVLCGLVAFFFSLRAIRRLDRDVKRLAADADRVAQGTYRQRSGEHVESPILARIELAMDRATDALAWREAEAKMLLSVSREISAASSMMALTERVQTAVEEMIPEARIGIVRLLDGSEQRLLAAAADLPLPAGTRELTDNSVYRRVMDGRSTFVVENLAARAYAEDAVLVESGFETYAVISVFVGTRAFAAVVVALKKGVFAPAQVAFLDTLVQQIAHQIEAAELRDSLAQSNEELQRATNAKSEFLAMMSHELRTPLNSVVGFAEVLADRKFGDLNDKQTRFIGNVLDSGRHLLRLINDLLDLSKIEAGQVEVTRHRCGPRALAVEVMQAVSPLAQSRHIALDIDDVSPPAVIADPVRVKQILFNFLSNALKFAPEGGCVQVVFSESADTVRIGVRDNGRGISVDEQQRLFKPFTQLDRTQIGGSSLGGTGLGLALARQLAHLMSGRVGVQSEPNAGAMFWLELPRTKAVSAPTRSESQSSNEEAPLALVVDDDPAARELIELALQAAGYRTVAASTGEEALAVARRARPMVITLDVFLPGIDGWDVLRVLGSDAITRRIPVVMLTISNDREKALTLGAVEHLVKPFDQGALTRAIPPAPASVGSLRVLLIDKDAAQAASVRGELVSRGFEVEVVNDGQHALKVLRDDVRIDLVLLDASLAEEHATHVIETVRAESRTRELPVVLLAHGPHLPDRVTRMVQAVLDKSALPPEELAREVGGIVVEIARAARG